MATHPNILAWKIPWTEEPGRLQSIGSQRLGHNWSDWHTCMFPSLFLVSSLHLCSDAIFKTCFLAYPNNLPLPIFIDMTTYPHRRMRDKADKIPVDAINRSSGFLCVQVSGQSTAGACNCPQVTGAKGWESTAFVQSTRDSRTDGWRWFREL